MQVKDLSKRDAVILLELINETLTVRPEQYAEYCLRKLNYLLDFKAATSLLGKAAADGSLEAWKLFDINYSTQYVEAYVGTGLHKYDPLILENFKHFRLQRWRDVFRLHPCPKALTDIGTAFGFNKIDEIDGYIHGVRNLKEPGGSLFSFYGLKNDDRAELILDLIVPHLHEAMRRMCNLSRRTAVLTEKEKEVLKWLKQGKTTWDISVILRISERTVKFHIGNILQKLDASNRSHAVAIALEQGILETE